MSTFDTRGLDPLFNSKYKLTTGIQDCVENKSIGATDINWYKNVRESVENKEGGGKYKLLPLGMQNYVENKSIWAADINC